MSLRRRPFAAVGVLVLMAVVLVGAPGVAQARSHAPGAGDTGEPTVPATVDQGDTDNEGRSIPLPNRGHEPTNPGDRGGWQQELVFALIVLGIATIVLLVWRESRRKRRHRTSEAP